MSRSLLEHRREPREPGIVKAGLVMSRAKQRGRRRDDADVLAAAPSPSPRQSRNLAARMGRWSAAHWKTATFGWLAFVVAALAVGSVVGTKQIDPKDSNVGQSRRADHMLRDVGFRPDPQTEIVLVQSAASTAREPAFQAVVRDVVDAVKRSPAIERLRSVTSKSRRLQDKEPSFAAGSPTPRP